MGVRSTLRICSSPDCGAVAPNGGLCPACRRAEWAAQDRRRPSSGARGYGERWRRTRSRVLEARPYCQRPGCFEPATEVHHLDELGPNGPRGHDQANLAALCKSHHSEITAREVFG